MQSQWVLCCRGCQNNVVEVQLAVATIFSITQGTDEIWRAQSLPLLLSSVRLTARLVDRGLQFQFPLISPKCQDLGYQSKVSTFLPPFGEKVGQYGNVAIHGQVHPHLSDATGF